MQSALPYECVSPTACVDSPHTRRRLPLNHAKKITGCRPPRRGVLSPFDAEVDNGWKRAISVEFKVPSHMLPTPVAANELSETPYLPKK